MARNVTPFLMFDGVAEKAMKFYVSLFNDAEILQAERYGAGEQGPEGSIKKATFTLSGQRFLCIDSPVKHDFDFTPAISIFVNCESEGELREVFRQLSSGGSVLMPVNNYGFSTLFGWLNDRFGVSWQLTVD